MRVHFMGISLFSIVLSGGILFAQVPSSELIANPPSTILAANTTDLPLTITSPTATNCGYSVGQDLPQDQMQPFTQGAGTTTHQAIIQGLNPDSTVVNEVYVRCDTNSEALRLQYRSLSVVTPSYPRTGNLWGVWNYYGEDGQLDLEQIAKIDLWLGIGVDTFTDEQVQELRRMNPNIRFLLSYNAVELGTDGWRVEDNVEDYFLKDINGNKIEVWPDAYRINLTKPEVALYMAQGAYQMMVDSNFRYDGIFIDNVFERASWFTQDIYGNPFPVDANQDGIQDNPDELDRIWYEGLILELRTLREYLPHAILSGHAQNINNPDMSAIFNSTSIGFDTVNVIEGKMNFSQSWERYTQWQTQALTPVGTMVESAIPFQIGYGYGYIPWDNIPASTLEFARTYYPYMRFGLAFTLMHDGYFAHEYGDTWHGNNWWYDELDFELGAPLGKAEFLYRNTEDAQNFVPAGDFEGDNSAWSAWFDEGNGYTGTFNYEINGINNSNIAHIEVTQTNGTDWQASLTNPNISITEGVTYDISFWARADQDRSIIVNIQKNEPDWDDYGLWQTVNLSGQWNLYTLSFTAQGTDTNARFGFNVGSSTGNVWFDDVKIVVRPPDVMRREFRNGLVLLNASTEPQTIEVGEGYQRLLGEQAPMHEYIIDNNTAHFSATNAETVIFDTEDWYATPPFYHNWGDDMALVTNGQATWNLDIPIQDTYTLTVWWAAAPEANTWSDSAVFEVMQNGQVVSSITLDQRTGGDEWHEVAVVNVSPGAELRLTCGGDAPCAADAVHVRSQARYNNGEDVMSVTLQPMDGIILKKR
jgi:hypothetical protein